MFKFCLQHKTQIKALEMSWNENLTFKIKQPKPTPKQTIFAHAQKPDLKCQM